MDTIGTQLTVLYTVEPLCRGHHWDPADCPASRYVPNSEVDLYTSLWLGQQTVSSLERCPLFRVSLIERFHCSGMEVLVGRWDSEGEGGARDGTQLMFACSLLSQVANQVARAKQVEAESAQVCQLTHRSTQSLPPWLQLPCCQYLPC